MALRGPVSYLLAVIIVQFFHLSHGEQTCTEFTVTHSDPDTSYKYEGVYPIQPGFTNNGFKAYQNSENYRILYVTNNEWVISKNIGTSAGAAARIVTTASCPAGTWDTPVDGSWSSAVTLDVQCTEGACDPQPKTTTTTTSPIVRNSGNSWCVKMSAAGVLFIGIMVVVFI